MIDRYVDAYKKSITDSESFWEEHAQDCHWYKKWEKVLDDSKKTVLPLVFQGAGQYLLQRS